MPRLVRRKPLVERLMAMLNPMDFLLWLSEEMETWDWESKLSGTQLGIMLNFLFLIARANSGSSASSGDDIFSDDGRSGWLAFLINTIVWGLVGVSCANAFHALTRTRKYRLFGVDVEAKPPTPSARRVKIASSMGSGVSTLRYLADAVMPHAAGSRAHPNKADDVWELSVWDPLPVSLRLFCLFSPGHVFFYLIFLPLEPLHPRPSVTVFNTLLVELVLSCQLLFTCSRFTQQAKDNNIVQREVMHEYDTKFVHPRLHPIVRDAGTQISDNPSAPVKDLVQVGTPTTLIRHSFRSKPNPYATPSELPATAAGTPTTVGTPAPQTYTPTNPVRRSEAFASSVDHSRLSTWRKSLPAGYTSSATSIRGGIPGSAMKGDLNNLGGYLGAHTHNESPLRKATSLYNIDDVEQQPSPRNSREMASYEQRRQGTPARKHSVSETPGSARPNPFALNANVRQRSSHDKYPSARQ
ncbi:Protein of unknown function (DUF2418) [Geosmithia morbida]|uniref:Meiotically up-regulated gene 154 protein n=1 Tax=Geosmithia morbida TaxID=1094350 RepID=A0A9P5D4U6_9HYPO|nr:Protein of unknown function (DUF2418) [Geosmithia morbida]KAF4126482.1 Protein of unknown function (DUF2418) [Geosmithia morbida]